MPSSPSPSSPPDEACHQLLAGLARIGVVLKAQAWQAAGPRGLTATQGQILSLLRGERGLRLSEVARGLGVTSATASDAVSALMAKGLLEKGRAPDDARARAIRLTPEGARHAEALAGWPAFMVEAVGSLSHTEQDAFMGALLKLLGTLEHQGRVPAARGCLGCRAFQADAHPSAERPHHCRRLEAPLAARELRLECPLHEAAGEPAALVQA